MRPISPKWADRSHFMGPIYKLAEMRKNDRKRIGLIFVPL